jgi:hypothetical protein
MTMEGISLAQSTRISRITLKHNIKIMVYFAFPGCFYERRKNQENLIEPPYPAAARL